MRVSSSHQLVVKCLSSTHHNPQLPCPVLLLLCPQLLVGEHPLHRHMSQAAVQTPGQGLHPRRRLRVPDVLTMGATLCLWRMRDPRTTR